MRRPSAKRTGYYTVSGPAPVGELHHFLKTFQAEAGELGTAFLGFDFPIGIPVHYANRAGVLRFTEWLSALGIGDWGEFYSVCDEAEEISAYRPFYPNGRYTGRRKRHLLERHGAASVQDLLRRCEFGGDGRREACCLFWTLGGNQVGKAAIVGWRDVLSPAFKDGLPLRLWPYDGPLQSLFVPGTIVVAETYPAEIYPWFDRAQVSKQIVESRIRFGRSLLSWAEMRGVRVALELDTAIRNGFQTGEDDAFDAVVGLFGMLQVCMGYRTTGEPDSEAIRHVEGWILGRNGSDP